MKELSIKYINSVCTQFENIIDRCTDREQYDKAERFLKALSYFHYKFYLGQKDDFVENQIQNLSQRISKKDFVNNNTTKSIVIVDEINADYIGLMVQYVTSLVADSYQILYLYERKEHPNVVRTNLMQTLQSYDKAEIKQIPSNLEEFSKSQWIYDEICAFGSKKVLLHLGEWAIEACVACAALPSECVKYRINCADHCFWAGISCVDYTFEFRHYGANLTYYERGLGKHQTVYVPFYPVMQEVPFAGFPKESLGKFIFLSGGAVYKIVNNENTFFRLCKSILDKCPESVVLFAGADAENSVIAGGIEQYGLQGRFIPIGYRKDILEVFRHCDVYLNTHPLGGGLMCQYAAQCSKPIINYKNNSDEECIAQKNECTFTSYTEADLLDEAVKLYTSDRYRMEKGDIFHNAVISKSEFDNILLSFLSTNKPLFEVKWNDHFIQKEYKIEDAIAYCNKKKASFYYKLYKLLGSDFICVMPGNFFSLGFYGIKRQAKMIFNRKSK